jgi:hypothetical protein
MLRKHAPNALLAGLITASFAGCSLPTGKYAQVHHREPVTGSHLGATDADADPAVADLSRTTNGISNPTQPTFGGGK